MPGKLEQAVGPGDEAGKAFARLLAGEIPFIFSPLERQHDVKLDAMVERGPCGDLVGPLCEL